MSKERKIDFLKAILDGRVPRQALNPPKFEMKIEKNGDFLFLIDGESANPEYFHKERKRLYVSPFDVSFDIVFRNETD